MTIAIAAEVSVHPPPEDVLYSPVELFVGMGDHPERYTWSNVLAALATFIYSCVPNAIVVETMAALPPDERPRMRAAVDSSFVALVGVYLVAGIVPVLRWGGDIPSQIPFSNSPGGVLINAILLFGTALDLVIAAITLNRRVAYFINPRFDYRWTIGSAMQWALYALPSAVLASALALFVPKLQSLTGLLTAFAAITFQVTATPFCLFVTTNPAVQNLKLREEGWRGVFFVAVVGYGLSFTLVDLSSAVDTIVTSDYVPGPNQTFWCDIVG